MQVSDLKRFLARIATGAREPTCRRGVRCVVGSSLSRLPRSARRREVPLPARDTPPSLGGTPARVRPTSDRVARTSGSASRSGGACALPGDRHGEPPWTTDGRTDPSRPRHERRSRRGGVSWCGPAPGRAARVIETRPRTVARCRRAACCASGCSARRRASPRRTDRPRRSVSRSCRRRPARASSGEVGTS